MRHAGEALEEGTVKKGGVNKKPTTPPPPPPVGQGGRACRYSEAPVGPPTIQVRRNITCEVCKNEMADSFVQKGSDWLLVGDCCAENFYGFSFKRFFESRKETGDWIHHLADKRGINIDRFFVALARYFL